MTWSVKGDSGSRFCSLCSNCFSHETDEDGIHIACRFTAHNQLIQHTSQEMFESWDRMAMRAEACSAADFKDWQQATGITYSKQALLACASLRHLLDPVKQWMHDYMHALLSNGLLSFGTFYVLEAMKGWDTFAGYIAVWTLPNQFKSLKVEKIFTNKRVAKHKASGKLNCSASELLSLLPVLAHFVRRVCREECLQEAEAFLCMNEVVEALHSGHNCRKLTGDKVAVLVEAALHAWKTAGWPFRKKNHWLLHMRSAVRAHGWCISCFTMERKHKVINRITDLIQRTSCFEESAMLEMATGELQDCQKNLLDHSTQLLAPRPAKKEALLRATRLWPGRRPAQLLAANMARCPGGLVTAGDVALFSADGGEMGCGRIVSHVQWGDAAKTVLARLSLLEWHSCHAVWQSHGSAAPAAPLQCHICRGSR